MLKKILITGGSGFIGSELVDRLEKEGHQIFVWDLQKGKNNAAKYTQINLAESVKEELEKIEPDIIYHLAAKTRGTYEELYSANVTGTKNLIECFHGRIIFLTTGMVYYGQTPPYKEDIQTNPIDNYGKTKKICEDLLNKRGNRVIVRASVVYGSQQQSPMFISSLKDAWKRKEVFKMTKGEQKRDFIHVKDLVEALVLLKEGKEGTFNIASGKSISLKEIVEFTKEIIGDFPVEESVPYRENEMWDYAFDISKARKELKWEPKITLKEGLKEVFSN